MNLYPLKLMKQNKHTYIFKNQIIHIEHSNKFSRFTGLKRLLINKDSK